MAALSTGYVNVWFTLRIKKKILNYFGANLVSILVDMIPIPSGFPRR